MKKTLLLGLLVISGLSFGSSLTYNENKDIVQPVVEQQEVLSANEQVEENFKADLQFHSKNVPLIYRDYIEEGSEDYLEAERAKDKGKIYYRDYYEEDEL